MARGNIMICACTLINVDGKTLRLLFANEIVTLSDDEKKKIVSIVKKFS